MKRNKTFVWLFLSPALLCFLIAYLYPVIRTALMSFFYVDTVTDAMNEWSFLGIENYTQMFSSGVFRRSLVNVFMIWLVEGFFVLALALLFAVIITSNIKGKSFWRALIYLPNVISAVALATMWLHFVFNNQYGFFKSIFEFLHWDSMASFQWTSPDHLFLSMMIAVAYGSIGYYMLIMTAGIDGIPVDYYEAATMEGAGVFRKTFHITIPLLKDIIKRCIILWTAGALGFFVWSKMFSFNTELATVTPVVYMYDTVFGKTTGSSATQVNVGVGAAVGVVVMILVLLVNFVMNHLIKTKSDREA